MMKNWSLLLFLFALPFNVLAGKFSEPSLRARHLGHARKLQSRNNTGSCQPQPFKLQDFYQGNSFLNDWEFFSGEDPTHGNVNYQTRENAINKGLAYVQQDGAAVLAVDDYSTVPVNGRRDSVRIFSKKSYSNGLFIADFFTMPHGCSVWPAYWSFGPNWPSAGEIDVLEGVHNQLTNQMSLHTSAGCSLPSKLSQTEATSNILHTECVSSGESNIGCSFSDTDPQSYGHNFNVAGGGVFAHLWDNTGIKIWRFSRGNIPADITSKNPNPASWGVPAANFPSSSCDIASHFFEHNLVINTSICGDFAGATYPTSGCPGTCGEAVANATNFQCVIRFAVMAQDPAEDARKRGMRRKSAPKAVIHADAQEFDAKAVHRVGDV
ncbi:putative endo-1,3(4)-beta-glucanase [Psilocybe cubensis]|uniref:Endo-1,3(4)-beta-glucanase n=2 Tax=Psilocybe cubensis TaxID=181762 RepID=A0ACB8GUY7_PSICU|nr:putative endo-1,3(4)-beta-glucanase [Psilocybe cubensis]KAH9479409.1 putative endo-1,3(4)-beta-glucanase [Psilocybe cubensis]